MEFTRYYGKHKYKNNLVVQEVVVQKYPVIRSRISTELKNKISQRAKEINSNESEMTRILWEYYFRKLNEQIQKAEVIHFLKNA